MHVEVEEAVSEFCLFVVVPSSLLLVVYRLFNILQGVPPCEGQKQL
jgi:hypothetical protein